MEGLWYLVAGLVVLLILAVMAIEFGADSRDGFGSDGATRPR